MLPSNRFWEIDFLRGAAIVMMVASNLVTDLVYFGVYASNDFWWWFARVTASLFILLAGVSLYHFSEKYKAQAPVRVLKRGAKIFGYGMLITLVTLAFLRSGIIVFGVLHFIGVATLLAYPLVRYKHAALLIGASALLLGAYLQQFSFDFPWLLWLGFVPQGFYSLDYFPLLPWFGAMLLGVFLGNVLYRGHVRRFGIAEQRMHARLLCFAGRHSLLIYLVHQPIILALLYTAGVIPLCALR